MSSAVKGEEGGMRYTKSKDSTHRRSDLAAQTYVYRSDTLGPVIERCARTFTIFGEFVAEVRLFLRRETIPDFLESSCI